MYSGDVDFGYVNTFEPGASVVRLVCYLNCSTLATN